MPEESPKEPPAITWVRQRALALWTTLGSGVLATVVTLLRESLSSDQLIATLLTVLATTTVLIWTFAAAASRQRSKFSKLEADCEALRAENSSLRSPPPIGDLKCLGDTEDKILLFVSEKREVRTEQIAHHLGFSEDRTKVYLTDLARMKFIYLQMYLGRPGKWSMGDLGRRYLVDHDLIQ